METLNVITACSRFEKLANMAMSFWRTLPQGGAIPFLLRWHVAFQSPDQPDPHGCVKFNELIDVIPADQWIWILDDDNLIHPKFLAAVGKAFEAHPLAKAFVFSQNRRDVLGPVLRAKPENMKVGGVDTAQVVFLKDWIGELRFPEDSKVADGIFYSHLFRHKPEGFVFIDDPVTHFNASR